MAGTGHHHILCVCGWSALVPTALRVCATPARCGYPWMGVKLPVAASCSQFVPVPLEGLQMLWFHSWGII